MNPKDWRGDEKDRANDPTEALVDRAVAGEKQAFDQIIRLHEAYVYRICPGITGNTDDAEDAMQNAFLKAFLSLSQFRREARFRSWLTRIAINEALQRLRKQKELAAWIDEVPKIEEDWMPKQISDWGPNPEQSLLAGELRQILEEAILALHTPYRIVFVLRDICGHSTPEVAAFLNLTIPAVKSRLLRARLQVRERLALRFKKKSVLRERFRQKGTVLRGLYDRFCRSVGLKH
ncbi:MAG: sigma-70 family RNA polymerase sigma factor [Acidobacteria bacterium]|nr:sigma-70 family RNA polymerase sigma factor [Acidobacteriota bacterium]